MRYLAFVATIALSPTGTVVAEDTPARTGDAVDAHAPAVLSEKQLDTVRAGRNVHIHPRAVVDTFADGLRLPDAAGVAAGDDSAVASHD